MGILTNIFNLYKNSNDEDKQEVHKKLMNILWNKSKKYIIYDKKIKFNINKVALNDNVLEDILRPYSQVSFKIAKSKRNNNMNGIDYIKVIINNMYGKYCDKNVYLNKDYYTCFYVPKHIYYTVLSGEEYNIEDIKQQLNENEQNIKSKYDESQLKKIDLSWEEYRGLIDNWMLNILNNYKSIDEYKQDNDWYVLDKETWEEDNYLIKYIKKSLYGYMRNYIKDLKKPKFKFCKTCGVLINESKPRQKYCDICLKKQRRYIHYKHNLKRRKKIILTDDF